jgi:hypothetical protein
MIAKNKEVKQHIETNTLAANAMLVVVSIRQWGNRRLDHTISDKAASEFGSEADMLRTWKRLIGKDSTKLVTTAFSHYKAHHYINTVPWLDNGYRMLPSANYLSYVEEERKLRQECMDAVDDFLKFYPKHREAAAKRLGKAFNEDDYPAPAALRHKWSIDIHFMPVPDKADFRIDLPAAELKRISTDIDAQVKIALENVAQDLFERLYTVVISLRDKLKDYKVGKTPKGKRAKTFRSSAVGNIAELCDLLPRLNVGNNPELTKLANEVAKSLGKYDTKVLKDDDDLRADAIKKADELLAKMADYVAG